MDPKTGLCAGCKRTIDEIAQWSMADEAWKRAVWEQLARRTTPDSGTEEEKT